jgi:hypothetical protein
MKLHPFKKWAFKLGVPLSVLNGFAQAYWGAPIPDVTGKYPDWWYDQCGLPQTVRDCEVPKEILRRYGTGRNRGTMSPKVYVRVDDGRVVEVVSNPTSVQSVPSTSAQPSVQQQRWNTQRTDGNGRHGEPVAVDTDEIVRRVIEAIRSRQVPTRSATAPLSPNAADLASDIMSLIQEETMAPTRVLRGTVNPGPAIYETDTRPSQPRRSVTMPARNSREPVTPYRSVPPVRTQLAGPSLPVSPRPVRQASQQIHQRTETQITNNTIPGYYFSPIAETTLRPGTPESEYSCSESECQHKYTASIYRSLDGVNADTCSEWSGYDESDDWEEMDLLGRTDSFRRAAQELREYRHARI